METHSKHTAAAAAQSLQSCLTLFDPIDGSPPGSSVPGILQARTLEWVAISFSNAWKWKVKVKSLSHVRLLATPWTAAYQAPLSMGFFRQDHWSGVPLPSLQHTYYLALLLLLKIHWFVCVCVCVCVICFGEGLALLTQSCMWYGFSGACCCLLFWLVYKGRTRGTWGDYSGAQWVASLAPISEASAMGTSSHCSLEPPGKIKLGLFSWRKAS